MRITRSGKITILLLLFLICAAAVFASGNSEQRQAMARSRSEFEEGGRFEFVPVLNEETGFYDNYASYWRDTVTQEKYPRSEYSLRELQRMYADTLIEKTVNPIRFLDTAIFGVDLDRDIVRGDQNVGLIGYFRKSRMVLDEALFYLALIIITIDLALLFLNGAAGLKKDMKSELMQRVIGYVLFSIVFYNQFAISGWVMNLFASFGISLGEGSFSFHTKLPSISGIVGRAFDLWGHEMTMWTEMNGIERITDGLMILIGFLATLFAFGYAAVHYTIALVEWQIVLIGVRVLLPLSLWDQTRSIALNAGKAIFTHAFKMMVLFFVIGVGEWLVPGELLAGLASFERIGAVVVLSFIYLTLVISVPQLAQSILSGNPGLTGGSMGQALSSVANTMRIARGATNMAMRAAGAAGAAAQAGMSGGMKAITRMSSIASAGSAAASETMRKTGSQSAAKAAGQKARQAMRQNMNQKLKADVGRALGGAASKMMFGNHFGGGKALGANTAFSKITADRSSTGFQHLGASIKAAGTVGKGFARAGADAARKASANVGKAGRGA